MNYPRRKAQARVRHTPGEMNGTERAYHDLLSKMKAEGKIHDFKFESQKFRLADRTWYTPDFCVIPNDMFIEFHEVKAMTTKGKVLCEDDARVKIKVVAEMFPEYRFVVVAKRPQKLGGGFAVEVIS